MNDISIAAAFGYILGKLSPGRVPILVDQAGPLFLSISAVRPIQPSGWPQICGLMKPLQPRPAS